MIRSLFRALRKSRFSYEPLVEVRIFDDAIRHNLRTFQRAYPQLGIAPVLKSNAYGHGLVQVAQIVARERVPFIVVDSYFEALVLRNEGIATPLLVIGFTPVGNIVKNKLRDVAFCITDIAQIEDVAHALRTTRRTQSFHLKIDTGMHRQGVQISELERALDTIHSCRYMMLEGVCSHLADADAGDAQEATTLTRAQINAWNHASARVRALFPNIKYTHISATAGFAHADSLRATIARLGIGLYGIGARADQTKIAGTLLKPALEMRSRICSIRDIEIGERVGYNGTFEAHKPTRVATIPAGYFEGVDRRLSNNGFVLVQKQDATFIPCPIIGRVSMNMTTIDISALPNARIGDTTVIISAHADSPASVLQIAKACNTIPYEILVHVAPHLRRALAPSAS